MNGPISPPACKTLQENRPAAALPNGTWTIPWLMASPSVTVALSRTFALNWQLRSPMPQATVIPACHYRRENG